MTIHISESQELQALSDLEAKLYSLGDKNSEIIRQALDFLYIHEVMDDRVSNNLNMYESSLKDN